MADAATVQILIDIRARLEAIEKTKNGLRDIEQGAKNAKRESENLWSSLRQGLGIGGGMELARRGINLVTGSIRQSVGAAFELAGQLKDTSDNLQITTEALQVLSTLAQENGAKIETLTMAIVNYRNKLSEARSGTGDAAKDFRQLGLEADQLALMPLEKQLEAVAQAMYRNGDASSAFDNAVNIFGSRNAPKLMQSLRELSEEGYGNLAEAMKKTGRVMEQETIERLDRAQKQIDKLKQSFVIGVGETIGAAADVKNSLRANFAGTAKALLKASIFGPTGMADLGATVASNVSVAPTANTQPVISAPKMANREDVLIAQIGRLQQAAADVQGNPLLDEIRRREQLSPLLVQQVRLYRELQELRVGDVTTPDGNGDTLLSKAAKGVLSEAELARFREYVALETKIRELDNAANGPVAEFRSSKVNNLLGEFFGDMDRDTAIKRSRSRFNTFNSERTNSNFLTPGQGVEAGAKDFVTSLGSQGEQVASSLEATLGATVNSISQGIYGWITGTQSFGETLMNLGSTVLQTLLQTIVQMGVQWLVVGAISKMTLLTTDGLQTALIAKKTTEINAANAATLPLNTANAAASSVSSFGLAAVLGLVALLAVMAMFGGFRERGGDAQPGRAYVVGEKRAEVFEPDQPGTVYPSVDDYLARSAPAATPAQALGGGTPVAASSFAQAFGAGTRTTEQKHYFFFDRSAMRRAMADDMHAIAHDVFNQRERG